MLGQVEQRTGVGNQPGADEFADLTITQSNANAIVQFGATTIIVANEDKDKTRRDVLSIVESALAREFSGDPAKVLG